MAIIGLGVESRSALFFLSWVVPIKKIVVFHFEKVGVLMESFRVPAITPQKGFGLLLGASSTK